MDTSEMSIARCIKAVEIQALWKPANGDFCWHDNDGDDYMGQWEFPAEWTIVHIDNVRPQDWWLNWVWLPHQYQLQEMLQFKCDTLAMILQFAEFAKKNTASCKSSMDQLWLAFVMEKKYNKIWNGWDWIVQTSGMH